MYCPECGAEIEGEARFCGRCGSPLPDDGRDVDGGGRVRRAPLVLAALAVALAAGLAVAARGCGQGGADASGPPEPRGMVALYGDGGRLVAGTDGTVHVRLRAPEGTGPLSVEDESGEVLATVDPTDMEPAGDGYLELGLEVPVRAGDAGAKTLRARRAAPGREGGTTGEDVSNQLDVKVLPDGGEVEGPIPDRPEEWALAAACAWVDEAHDVFADDPEEVAEGLERYLNGSDLVLRARRYGTAVVFEDAGRNLNCVDLAAGEAGALGSGGPEADGPAMRAFTEYESGGRVGPGAGIRAGNTLTATGALLLNPTPQLMDAGVTSRVESACAAFASSVGGALVTRGEDSLADLLGGGAYGKGLVVLRAHGGALEGSDTALMRMSSAVKGASRPWDDVRAEYEGAYARLAASCPVAAEGYFCGSADAPNSWELLVHACPGGGPGEWDVGFAMSPNLLEHVYDAAPLDDCILWVGSCGALADASLASWAAAHNVQLLVGYEGAVSESDDADALAGLLAGLAEDGPSWRTRNVWEATRGRSGGALVAAGEEGSFGVGNQGFFARGKSGMKGTVVGAGGAGVGGAEVRAWLYRDGTFVDQGAAASGPGGGISLDGLPCGRYVVRASKGDATKTFTVVLDEELVDVGEVELEVGGGDADPAPALEPKQYEVDYLWQARSSLQGEQEPFRTLVGEGIPEDAVIGVDTDDYDGDGAEETLAVLWRDGTVCLEIRDADGTAVASKIVNDEDRQFDKYAIGDLPFETSGCLDVLTDENHCIAVQYWSRIDGIGDTIGTWQLNLYKLQDDGIEMVGTAATDTFEISEKRYTDESFYEYDYSSLKKDLADIGLSTSAVPEYAETDGFLTTMLADTDPSFRVVTRVAASDEDFCPLGVDYSDTPAYEAWHIMDATQQIEWSEPRKLGTLTITQPDENMSPATDGDSKVHR